MAIFAPISAQKIKFFSNFLGNLTFFLPQNFISCLFFFASLAQISALKINFFTRLLWNQNFSVSKSPFFISIFQFLAYFLLFFLFFLFFAPILIFSSSIFAYFLAIFAPILDSKLKFFSNSLGNLTFFSSKNSFCLFFLPVQPQCRLRKSNFSLIFFGIKLFLSQKVHALRPTRSLHSRSGKVLSS